MDGTIAPYPIVILDLGSVIINLDVNRTWSALKRMAGSQWARLEQEAQKSRLYDFFETGVVSVDQFREFFNYHLSESIPAERFDVSFNAMLLDIPASRIEFLRKLGKRKRLILLSNTNPIHMAQINSDLQRFHGLPDLNPLFERVYLSYEVGCRKPEPEIYQHVLKDASLDPAQCLFVDDTAKNLDAAAKLGIAGLHLPPEKPLESVVFP